MPILTIFAEGEQAAGAGQGGIMQFLPMMLIVLFVVVFVLPKMRNQKREAAEMMASIKNGAKVVLSGGIIGTVAKVTDGEDEVIIRSEDTKLRVLRSSIVRVIVDTPAEAAK
ncbi:MAG: preprotein translocase subunit YajC [Fimbriiglobus sp.]